MKIELFSESIRNFIFDLDTTTRAKTFRVINLLENHGQSLGMPYSKSLKGGLFELRILGEKHVRLIYSFYKGRVVILNAFIKKTNKIPAKELALATKRRKSLA